MTELKKFFPEGVTTASFTIDRFRARIDRRRHSYVLAASARRSGVILFLQTWRASSFRSLRSVRSSAPSPSCISSDFRLTRCRYSGLCCHSIVVDDPSCVENVERSIENGLSRATQR